ncbi:exodeoxyribonuclease III [Marinicella sp. S1101]|uniref:exodeoxyribonuclease III n=1 Tax=Marinicella marina TaxID=2996016 RepID=UPI002260D677|nr:exodeoxyribonuclease III [Marinicella marina]MCX7553176.1 exodeoxyribonuclease III [Marinicella marina]MDJ1138908.1 exodeoxyribonuclease III [Marinicella marina]
MKIASWNVNSLNVRLEHVLQWLDTAKPDILALQETKMTDDNFPLKAIESAGYQVVFSGQKTYNGVAIIAKEEPTDMITDIPGLDDPQRRILAATVDDVRIIDLYVVNGSAPGTEKFTYKLNWLDKVTAFIEQQMNEYDDVVVLGDFNIAPDDRDVHDPEKWHEKILCTTEERNALNGILDLGLQDSFRLLHDEGGLFSWWDYRMNGFARDLGLRIDLVLCTDEMSEALTAAYIDIEPRKWERPSDHTPVIAEFDW